MTNYSVILFQLNFNINFKDLTMIPLTIISIMANGGSIPRLWRSIKAPQTCLCLVVVFHLRVNYRNFASTNWTCIKPGEVNVYLTPQTNSSGNWRDGSSHSTPFSRLGETLRSTWEWGNPIDKAPQPIQLTTQIRTRPRAT